MTKVTTEQFIERANGVHGNRYDYSKSVYVKSALKLKILCKKHGVFEQSPNKHLAGRGCPKCKNEETSKRQSLGHARFIESSKKMHGEKYDYSKSKYTKAVNKVAIICPEHGEFKQEARLHMMGRGCGRCGGVKSVEKKRLTQEEFLKRAKQVHTDKYDYSESVFVQMRKKVTIICKKHGFFEQTPFSHIYAGAGCPDCAKIKRTESTRLTFDEFVAKAKEKHGNLYGYDCCEYKSMSIKVSIKCPVHGIFEQNAASHISGCGCPQCAKNHKKSQSDFLDSARKVHLDKYDYSKSVYSLSTEPLVITCPTHGDFLQQPTRHISGAGCPKCGGSELLTTEEFVLRSKERHGDKYDYSQAKYINSSSKVQIRCPEHGNFFQVAYKHMTEGHGCPYCPRNYSDPCAVYVKTGIDGECKIGVAIDPIKRLSKLMRKTPFFVKLHCFVTCKDTPSARAVESAIHRILSERRCGYVGFDGATEWFKIKPEDATKLVNKVARELSAEA